MKKWVMILMFCLGTVLPAGCEDEVELVPYPRNVTSGMSYLPWQDAVSRDTVSVLVLGNSFSFDALYYLPSIVRAQGKLLVLGNLIYSGCTLKKHCQLLKKKSAKYDYKWDVCGTGDYETKQTLTRGLFAHRWDVIFLQQASSLSGVYDSYLPYALNLQDTISAMLDYPVEWGWHQTWAYKTDAQYAPFRKYRNSQELMWKCILAASDSIARDLDVRLFAPSGTAIQYLRDEVGENVCRDTHHLNSLGCYAVSCVWYEMLFGEPATDITYKPAEIADAEAETARKAAHSALADPFGVKRLREKNGINVR